MTLSHKLAEWDGMQSLGRRREIKSNIKDVVKRCKEEGGEKPLLSTKEERKSGLCLVLLPLLLPLLRFFLVVLHYTTM